MRDIEIGSIRPPSESNSLLIRVTRGCHWNKCYFCGLYKSMRFSMRPIDETIEDIRRQAQLSRKKKITSCFLQDGDALVLKTDYLLRILEAINQSFPDMQYITSYARADRFLQQLHEMDSYYVNEHIVNLLLEVRGNLRTEKQEMLSTIDRFLTLPPDERLLFTVGRRLNIFFRLDDLKKPKLHQKAGESLQQILSKNPHVDFAALCNYVRQSQI